MPGDFAVPAAAQALVGGAVIKRRVPGYRFLGATIARLVFVRPAPSVDGPLFRDAAERFFGAVGTTFSPAQLRAAQLSTSETIWRIATPDPAAVAFSVPASGAMMLRYAASEHATTVRDPSEAVSVALQGVADGRLLNLAANETLDLISIKSIMRGSPTGSIYPDTVGYQVVLGRMYRGVPVLGPPTLVQVGSDGQVTKVIKGWRDMVGESGSVKLADAATISSRRDPLMVSYLKESEVSCGYSEDPDPLAVQDSPGVACQFTYEDPQATDQMARVQEDWVNAADDSSLALRGTRAGSLGATRPTVQRKVPQQ